jgi:hypothetical protein
VFGVVEIADVAGMPLSYVCCCKRSCAGIVGIVGALRTIELAGAGFCGAAVDDGDGFASVIAGASGLGCAGLVAAKTGVAVAGSGGLSVSVGFLRAQTGAAGRFSIDPFVATEPIGELGQGTESMDACGDAVCVADSDTGVIAAAGAAVMGGICRGAEGSIWGPDIVFAGRDVSRTAETKGMPTLPLVGVG